MPDPRSKLMKGLLEVLILHRLEQGPSHGYGLLKEIEALFGAEPNRNRVYPLLQRMEREGLVARAGGSDERGRPRQDFVLTDVGLERLEAYRGMPVEVQHAMAAFWSGPSRAGAPSQVAAAGAESRDARAAAAASPGPGGAAAGPSGSGDGARAPAQGVSSAGASSLAPGQPAPASAGLAVPVRGPATASVGGEALPYPCPEARVRLEKDPRTGVLAASITGCPMGAFEYCPQCPVWKSVEGMRRLVFG